MWGLMVKGGKIQQVDWRNYPPSISDLPNSNVATAVGASGVAIDDCGRLAFYTLHTGSDTPNQLILYAADGSPLLNVGQGLNAVPGNTEMQVVRLPGASNIWYVIYSYRVGTLCSGATWLLSCDNWLLRCEV